MRKPLALITLLSYLFLLTWMSFIDTGKLPSLGSSFDDKIFHVLSHTLLTYLAYNFFKRTLTSKPLLISAIFAIDYGILIEVLQGVFSNLRVMDGGDVLANILGTIFAVLFITFLNKGVVKLK